MSDLDADIHFITASDLIDMFKSLGLQQESFFGLTVKKRLQQREGFWHYFDSEASVCKSFASSGDFLERSLVDLTSDDLKTMCSSCFMSIYASCLDDDTLLLFKNSWFDIKKAEEGFFKEASAKKLGLSLFDLHSAGFDMQRLKKRFEREQAQSIVPHFSLVIVDRLLEKISCTYDKIFSSLDLKELKNSLLQDGVTESLLHYINIFDASFEVKKKVKFLFWSWLADFHPEYENASPRMLKRLDSDVSVLDVNYWHSVFEEKLSAIVKKTQVSSTALILVDERQYARFSSNFLFFLCSEKVFSTKSSPKSLYSIDNNLAFCLLQESTSTNFLALDTFFLLEEDWTATDSPAVLEVAIKLADSLKSDALRAARLV